ncbi:MAG TPA: polyhydroxyalkanoate depolymerase [Aquabacterium sp.]|uniref:polyhydroxyalkanoate depolymerase n=1 Tax=Aquabacterium sp. TaxID=1872578 RepID=UPI002E349FAF|nr:polyhydroxyalkanoate depolymerase [Aquabacterium sp.]HEX5372443.1 polyhydroxyalkanoate depolymerase [Aquabacterium sp.]
MLYATYDLHQHLADPLRLMSRQAAEWLHQVLPSGPPQATPHELAAGGLLARRLAGAVDVFSRWRLTHTRPAFGIETVQSGGQTCGIIEESVMSTPFATLLRFRKDRVMDQPPVLLVAPMSGHFATLLRDTVRTLLQDHDVYITDWHNARDVPLRHGVFGLDDYTHHLIRFMDRIGPGVHLMAICQPCVASLAATALMAQDNHPAQPRSLTLMAGPIDCRVNPTAVNELATSKPLSWFEQNMIHTVPWTQRGAGRKVYPGFVQLSAFMSMNMERHLTAFRTLHEHISHGEHDKAASVQAFYEEYFAVADLPADFYLETVGKVFQTYDLPRGVLTWRGAAVEPRAIRKTALFTVEGERDDICAVGQTVAAQDLCTSVRPYLRNHHVQTGVGHYGVFSGRRWQNEIYPRVREAIHQVAL